MDDRDKENLVRQFRVYLDQRQKLSNEEQSPDLFSFYRELISLKNEVKIESRQVKNGLDEFCSAVSSIEENHQRIIDRFEKNGKNRGEELERALMRPVFTGLLDIHDRLLAGRLAGRQHKSSLLTSFCKKDKAVITAMREGQEMTLNRINELFVSFGVKAIAAVGQRFDPHIMRAIAVDSNEKIGDGVVTVELRKGFMWKEEVVRMAEVKVNKNREI